MNERAFLDEIAENPKDPAIRLVFADWLEDNADPRAELLRLQAEWLRGEDRPDVERRADAWMAAFGHTWLGEPDPHVRLKLHEDLCEVRYPAATLEHPDLWQAIRGGWVRRLRLAHLTEAQLTPWTKDGLLARLGELHMIGCACNAVTLKRFAGLTQLRRFELSSFYASITDDALAHLADLIGLREFALAWVRDLSGAGLAHLTRCRKLRHLSLANCRDGGDAATEHLAEFTDLEDLALSATAVTNRGLSVISALTGLRRLLLSDCRDIDDAGMASLARMQLEHLSVSGCSMISAAGLAQLRPMKTLKKLYCSLPPNAARKLRETLPGCEVVT